MGFGKKKKFGLASRRVRIYRNKMEFWFSKVLCDHDPPKSDISKMDLETQDKPGKIG